MSRKSSRLDKAYRHWIQSLPCLVCKRSGLTQRGSTEAHHAGIDKGMALKPPDSTCIPLCGEEHHRTGRKAWHRIGREAFERAHGIDVAAEIRRLNQEYEGMGAKLKQPKHGKPNPAVSVAKKPTSQLLRELREKRAK